MFSYRNRRNKRCKVKYSIGEKKINNASYVYSKIKHTGNSCMNHETELIGPPDTSHFMFWKQFQSESQGLRMHIHRDGVHAVQVKLTVTFLK